MDNTRTESRKDVEMTNLLVPNDEPSPIQSDNHQTSKPEEPATPTTPSTVASTTPPAVTPTTLSAGTSPTQPAVTPTTLSAGTSPTQPVVTPTTLSAGTSPTQPTVTPTTLSAGTSSTQPAVTPTARTAEPVGSPDKPCDNTHHVLIFILRLCLFSPLKWTDCTLKFSIIHIIWLFVHVAKLVILTMLTFSIGHCRETLATTITDGYTTLQHTLLKDWTASFETLPYPPAHGQFASYSIEDLKSRINYTVAKIYNVEAEANGYFERMPYGKVTITIYFYNIESNLNRKISKVTVEEPTSFEPRFGLSNFTNQENVTVYDYDVTKDLINMNLSTVLHRLTSFSI